MQLDNLHENKFEFFASCNAKHDATFEHSRYENIIILIVSDKLFRFLLAAHLHCCNDAFHLVYASASSHT